MLLCFSPFACRGAYSLSDVVLSADDECQAGSQCGLSALQVATASERVLRQQMQPSGEVSLSIAYAEGSTTADARLRRIEYITVTVDDLKVANVFYGKLLGGTELPFCKSSAKVSCTADGFVQFSGDDHLKAMVAIDKDAGTLTPDISANGDYEVLSQFFLIGDSIIQTMMYADKQSGQPFNLRENRTAATWSAKSHMDFWVGDGVDARLFVKDVEETATSTGLSDVKFNRIAVQKSVADRAAVPLEHWANCADSGLWAGNCAAYWKGPAGEQLEIYTIERSFKEEIGRAYCSRRAVSSAFVSETCPESYCRVRAMETKKPIAQRLHGLFQYGVRTSDLHKSTGFYTEVLGGDLISKPQGIGLYKSDAFQWQIFANETFEAWKYADEHSIPRQEAMQIFGIPDISSSGTARLDLDFILFDNFVVEALEYTNGLTYGGEGYDPQLNHSSSPAYIGTVTPAFGVGAEDSLAEYLHKLHRTMRIRGFPSAQVPQTIAGFEKDHPYHGLEYGYGKGPDGEALTFVKISGHFQEILKQTMLSKGAVSTMFHETNAFANGAMRAYCSSVEGPPK